MFSLSVATDISRQKIYSLLAQHPHHPPTHASFIHQETAVNWPQSILSCTAQWREGRGFLPFQSQPASQPASQSISPQQSACQVGQRTSSQIPDIDMPLQSAGRLSQSHKSTAWAIFPFQKTLSWIFSAVQKTKTLKLEKHHETTEPATNCAFHTSHVWRGLAEAEPGHNYAGCVIIPPVSRIGDIGGVHSSPKHHSPFWDWNDPQTTVKPIFLWEWKLMTLNLIVSNQS